MAKSLWKKLTELVKAEPDEDDMFKTFHDRLGKAIEGYGDGAGLPADHPLHALKALHKEYGDVMLCNKSVEPPSPEDVEVAKREAEAVEIAKAADVAKAAEIAKATEDISKKLVETEAVLKAERDATALAATVTLLKSFTGVSVNPEADAPLFKRLAENDKPAYDRLVEVLKGADAAVDLTKAIGSDQPGDAKSGANAWAQLEAEAAKLQKEDSTVTKAKALDIVMKKRPDLVKAHYDEQGA